MINLLHLVYFLFKRSLSVQTVYLGVKQHCLKDTVTFVWINAISETIISSLYTLLFMLLSYAAKKKKKKKKKKDMSALVRSDFLLHTLIGIIVYLLIQKL